MTPLEALEFVLSEVGCLNEAKCPHWVEWHNVARAAVLSARTASADTHPKGGDVKQAPSLMGSAVPSETSADAQGPSQ